MLLMNVRWLVLFSWSVTLCCVTYLPSYAQDSTPCRKKLKTKDFKGAVACFEELYEKYPDKVGYLRNQAIIYRMWSQSLKAKQPAPACHLLKTSIKRYAALKKRVKGVERLEVDNRINRLQKQLGLSSLSVASTPNGAQLTLIGYRYQKVVKTPFIFLRMCPGDYTLQLEKKDYFPIQKQLKLVSSQPSILSLQLKPRDPMQVQTCPADVLQGWGRPGCKLWSECEQKKKAKSCVELAEKFRRSDSFIIMLRYLSAACRLGRAEACHETATALAGAGKIRKAMDFYGQACQRKFSRSCAVLGDIFAKKGRFLKQLERIRSKRTCKQAIIYYDRACRYGKRSACEKTCNTTNVTLPTIVHSSLHVGTALAGIGIFAISANSTLVDPTVSFIGGVLGYSTLSLLITGAYTPLWIRMMEVHSMGHMIWASVTNLAPLLVGGSFLLSELTTQGEFFRLGIALLVAAFPVHLMWTIYGWVSYAHHRRIADRDRKTPDKRNPAQLLVTEPRKKVSVEIEWGPMFLKDGMGVQVMGRF